MTYFWAVILLALTVFAFAILYSVFFVSGEMDELADAERKRREQSL